MAEAQRQSRLMSSHERAGRARPGRGDLFSSHLGRPVRHEGYRPALSLAVSLCAEADRLEGGGCV